MKNINNLDLVNYLIQTLDFPEEDIQSISDGYHTFKELYDHRTYHLPMSEWDRLNSDILEKAPEWDGHTSDDVLSLLNKF